MARLPYIEAGASPEVDDLFAEITRMGRPVANLYRMLANQPPALAAFLGMSRYVRAASSLDPGLRELSILATARELGQAALLDRPAGGPQLLPALRRDPVGRPRVVEDDVDVGLAAELLDPRRHPGAHHLERRTAEEGGCEPDVDSVALDRDLADDSEIDDRDRRDLRILDLRERVPDLLRGHHAAPGTERLTIVISSQSAGHSSSSGPRPAGSTSSSRSRSARAGRSSASTRPSA